MYHEQNWQEVKSVWIIKVGVERANWFSAVGDSAQWGSMVEWKCTQRWKQARGPRRSTGVPNHPCLVTSIDLWHIAQLGWGRQKMLSHLNSHQTKFQLQYGIHQILAWFLFQSGSLANIILSVVVLCVKDQLKLIELEILIWAKNNGWYEHGKRCGHWPLPIIENNSRPENF